MKKYIIITIVALVFGLILLTNASDNLPNYTYNAWDNYHGQYGEYFDRFFNQPRILHYPTDRIAHERTLRELARLGIPYHNQYTGEYNHVQTPEHIFNTSKTVEEYRFRMEIWKRYGNVIY